MALNATDRRQFQLVGLVAVIAVLLATAFVVIARPPGRSVVAYFTSATAVFEDNSVRVLGVNVGTIDRVVPEGTRVRVEMTIDDPDLVLPADARAVVISPSLVTGRYVQLTPTYSGGPELADGAEIPVERTAVPLDVDDLARTATDLTEALGPNGVNRDGSLSRLLDVGAENLGGNGQAINDTITDLGELSGTLADSREELFGTVTELQRFVSVIAANDAEVREFNTRLEDVSGFLADERGDLGAALQELSIALGEVAAFVRDNREILASNVDRLTDVTGVLVRQQQALAETLDTAPTALGNLANAYNGSSGTLDTRANINELTLPPLVLICELLERGTPEALADLPIGVSDACAALGPLDQLPLPSAAEVITSLQAGEVPPVPGLALPTAPAAAAPAAPAVPLEGGR
ncbi:MCE family protein [Pseudonocardia abyssalis]|uniref:MCE family protein n=2 Tax=Pseudonocardia abyssalis TaxID=2792008 RepID=A0ABS6V0R0_9PSEU|nr:MCE family protein [Pseudonocardia abyssalis]MBW0138042.1 MCE family protein [Pseudonocardia abyssalis]